MKKYKAILFDIDGVLVDSADANVAYLNFPLNSLGFPSITREEYLPVAHMTRSQAFEFFSDGKKESVHALIEIAKSAPRPIHLYKKPQDSDQVLQWLQATYLLGIASNRVADGIDAYLDFAGTRDLFSVTVSSEEIAKPKPDPEMLCKAAEKFELPTSEILYVGDTETDKKAAEAADMSFILFGHEPVENVVRAKDFASLAKLLLD